jgi:hypothetical protein
MIVSFSLTAVKKCTAPCLAIFRPVSVPVSLLILALSATAGGGATPSPVSPRPGASLAASSADAQKPSSSQFEGSFDKLDVVSLGGWAWDGSKPNAPIEVEVYDGTTLLSKIRADGFREDLKAAGKGDGKHAFNYAPPQTLRDGQSHTISVKYAGTTSELPGSPKTLLFPKP